MIVTLIIFLITIIAMICSILVFPTITIFKKKIQSFWIITLLGFILMIIFNRLDMNEYILSLKANSSINPLKIIVLFFSMTFLSCYLDEQGFFKYLAIKAINNAKSNQFTIFTIFYFLVSILTIFTSNDVIILTFTPFICYFCKHSKINPIPYLIAEFVAANTLSMSLLIGNPTNIYLGLSANISFIDYFKEMFFKSLLICIVTYVLLFFIFKSKLSVEMEKENVEIKLNNKLCIIVGLVSLVLCIIGMAISSYIDIDMYLISLSFTLFNIIFSLIYELIIKKNIHLVLNTLKRLPYALIPFLLSMFGLISSLEQSGIVDKIASTLYSSNEIFVIGYSSFITCSLTNNIPMSVLYASILETGNFTINGVYAAIIGSNIGALFTPVGALAGIMFINIVNQTDTKFTYKDFIIYGMPISIFLITLSLILLGI